MAPRVRPVAGRPARSAFGPHGLGEPAARSRRRAPGWAPRPSPGPAARCHSAASAPGLSPSSASAAAIDCASSAAVDAVSATPDVDEDLRQPLHHRRELGQRPPSAIRASSCRPVRRRRRWWRGRADDVPDCSPPSTSPPAHRLEDVAVADRGLHHAIPRAASRAGSPGCTSRSRRRVDSASRRPASRARGPPGSGRRRRRRRPGHGQAAVGVAVVGDARVGAVLTTAARSARGGSTQPSLMLSPSGSAAIAITGARAAQGLRRRRASRAVGAVDDDAQAVEAVRASRRPGGPRTARPAPSARIAADSAPVGRAHGRATAPRWRPRARRRA